MKIGQYLANIWTRDEWLLFFETRCRTLTTADVQ